MHQTMYWLPPFRQRWPYSSFVASPWPADSSLHSLCAWISPTICQTLLSPLLLGAHTGSQPQGQGVCVWVRHTEHWGHPCARWRICRWGIPSGSRAGFLNVVNRLCAPLTPSEGATCHSPSLPASQSCSSRFSTLDVGRERKELPWQPPVSHVSLTSSHFPWEKSQAEISLGPKLCPLGGRDGASQVKLFLSSSQCFQTPSFSAPKVCWNFSSGNQDLYKGSMVCGWLS